MRENGTGEADEGQGDRQDCSQTRGWQANAIEDGNNQDNYKG